MLFVVDFATAAIVVVVSLELSKDSSARSHKAVTQEDRLRIPGKTGLVLDNEKHLNKFRLQNGVFPDPKS